MPDDDVIDVMSFRKAHYLLCRMAYRDVNVGLEGLVHALGLNPVQHTVVVPARLLNHGLRLDHTAELRRPHDRQDVQ
jgi:hypothetical protein